MTNKWLKKEKEKEKACRYSIHAKIVSIHQTFHKFICNNAWRDPDLAGCPWATSLFIKNCVDELNGCVSGLLQDIDGFYISTKINDYDIRFTLMIEKDETQVSFAYYVSKRLIC